MRNDTDDLISRQAAIDFIDAGHLCNPNEPRWSDNEIVNFLKSRPSAQPEPANSLTKSDMISKQKVKYKLTALVNEIEEIFANIREREVNDSVCGLCEYDGAYIGQSGDWCNECPGFDKDDCFKLKEKYRKEWTDING